MKFKVIKETLANHWRSINFFEQVLLVLTIPAEYDNNDIKIMRECAYNAGLIPVAGGILVPFMGVGIFGWLPMLAGLAMAMSSVTVVGNSILLGRYKPRFAVSRRSRREEEEEIYSKEDLKQVYAPKTTATATTT